MRLSPVLVLLASLLVTFVSTYYAHRAIEGDKELRFESSVRIAESRIYSRLQKYGHLLLQTRSFYAVKGRVSYEDFHKYFDKLGLEQTYPGLQGVGYVHHVSSKELSTHLQFMKSLGFSDYKIWPDTPREDYFPIAYIEPRTWRNERAIGYDMFTEPVRHAAMKRAWTSGEISMTAKKITLVQETNEDPQSGFLLYLAIPEVGEQIGGEKIQGFVYIPFRARDFFEATFPRHYEGELVDFLVYCDQESEDQLIYSTTANPKDLLDSNEIQELRPIHFAGVDWKVRFFLRETRQVLLTDLIPGLVLFSGVLISVLLFFLVRATSRKAITEEETRANLEKMVEQRTHEINRQKEFLNAVLENIEAGVVACDENGKLTFFNRATREFHGLPAQPLPPEEWGKYYSLYESDQKTPLEMERIPLFRALYGQPVKEQEMVIIPKDQEPRIVVASGQSIKGPSGRSFGAVVVMHDITETKKSQQALEESNLSYRVANQELEAFAYSVSHDLRTPLRGVDGFSKALLEDYTSQLDEQAKHYLNYIREGVQRMGVLIDNLLSLSLLSRVEVNKVYVNLSEIAEKVTQRLQEDEPQRTVKMNIQPDMMVLGDENLLTILMENLLGNAWKFTANKSVAEISVVSVSEDADRATFCVRDNGAGFDMAYQSKLFGAFQRLHSPKEFSGTGIGLATVRRVIQRHGGRVWAEGEVGEGASFYFTLRHGR